MTTQMIEDHAALVTLQDPSTLDYAADPAAYVLLACERAKAWLANVLEHGGIDDIVELKSQAEAIRVYTQQKELGKDAELAAAEIVRRAERGLGLAIRRGQAAGEVMSQGDTKKNLKQHVEPETGIRSPVKRSPKEFFSNHGEATETYVLADQATDDQFEDAVDAAKSEGNLSRQNLVRKLRGSYREPQRPAHLRKTHHFDSNRIVEQTVLMSGLPKDAAEFIEFDMLDRDRIPEWISGLTEVIKQLSRLRTQLRKELDRGNNEVTTDA